MNNDLSLHRPALYNPALWSRDEVKTYYIARQSLLTRLLDDLRRERPGSRPQHRLMLGLRGMGKSTLLRRLAVAVEDDAELTAQWLPLTFSEEQYNVGSLADLWLNCLDALGDLLEGRGRSVEAEQLDNTLRIWRGRMPKAPCKHCFRRLSSLTDVCCSCSITSTSFSNGLKIATGICVKPCNPIQKFW